MTIKSILFGVQHRTDLRARGVTHWATSVASSLVKRADIRRIPARYRFIPLAILFAWCAVSPARAVTPAPDGGYPNNNTAEGTDALLRLTTGSDNTAIGFDALYSNTTGLFNTASGYFALRANTTGPNNTATGFYALMSNTGGGDNTANGSGALEHNTNGNFNTASGYFALRANTIGANNTATGFNALFSNTTGNSNTASGYYALKANTVAFNNTANGFEALQANTTGSNNTADGSGALQNNTTGGNNTANGLNALQSNTTGGDNTANGLSALSHNTTGRFNAAIGEGSLQANTTGSTNTAQGFAALASNTTGGGNIALGSQAGLNLTTGNSNIDIGNRGFAGESGTIRIGDVTAQNATFIAGIRGVTVASGVGVIVGTDGQLGTTTSSERFKEGIKPMDQASEAILALKPVTFRYKRELDPAGIPQFGLVAEQVEKVNPNLVARDGQGKVNTVRYEAVNAMLLNEFLKEHRKVQELEATITEQQKDLVQQQKEIKALAASLNQHALQIQKLSSRLEMSKPALQTAADR